MTSVLTSGARATAAPSTPFRPGGPKGPDDMEMSRIARRAAAAQAIAGQVSVRVDVTAREGVAVDPGRVAALRELCETAPAVVGYLLDIARASACPEPVDDDPFARELGELVAKGLIVGERDAGGELRFWLAEQAEEAGRGE